MESKLINYGEIDTFTFTYFGSASYVKNDAQLFSNVHTLRLTSPLHIILIN